jgi:hypothetical protein
MPLVVVMVSLWAGSGAAEPGDQTTSAPVVTASAAGGAPFEVPPSSPLDGPEATYDAWFRVAGTALKPRDSDALYQPAGGGGCFYAESGPHLVYNYPLSLPHGSTLKYFRLYYNDTSASDSTAYLTVYDLYGSIVQEWSVSSSGSLGNGYNTTAEITHVVDYWNYSYMINWRASTTGSAMQICGFRVYYRSVEIFSDRFEVGNTSRWSATVP